MNKPFELDQHYTPYEVVNGDGAAPLLLVCDHASNYIPPQMKNLGVADHVLGLHVAYDIGAAGVTRKLAEKLDATAVLSRFSRLLIDPNRQPGDPSAIPKVSDTIDIPGNQDLSEKDQIRRTESFHVPYHHEISARLDHLWRKSEVPPAFFSIHTFTPKLGGEDRYWHIGVLWNRDPRLPEPLIERLRSLDGDLHVGDNEPYSGRELAYTLNTHAGAAGLPHCAVEIRQDLVEGEDGQSEWAERLGTALSEVLARDDLHQVEHF